MRRYLAEILPIRRKTLSNQLINLTSDGRNMPPYSSSIKPHNMIGGYLVCRKESEQPLPAVPLVKMLTMLGNFTGFFHMDWHHLVHSLKIQECKKKCIMYRKFIVNHYEIEIFTIKKKSTKSELPLTTMFAEIFPPLIRSVWIV